MNDKPVGTVLYQSHEPERPGSFDVAVHTPRGWFLIDQCGVYPFTQPASTGWTKLI